MKNIIYILLLLPIMISAQSTPYDRYKAGLLTKAQLIEIIESDGAEESVRDYNPPVTNYDQQARLFMNSLTEQELMLLFPNSNAELMDGFVGTAISILSKAFKWMAQKNMFSFLGPLINCNDQSKMYEEIGRAVVQSQLNPFLESIGVDTIE